MGDYREFRAIVPIDRWNTPALEKIQGMIDDPGSILHKGSAYHDAVAEAHLATSDPNGSGTFQFNFVFNVNVKYDDEGYDFIRWLATVSPLKWRTLVGWERADQAEIPTLIYFNADRTASFLRPSRTEINPSLPPKPWIGPKRPIS